MAEIEKKNEVTIPEWKKHECANLLVYVQQKLVAPKMRENTYGKYFYRSCEDILQAVKPLLGNEASLTFQDEVVFNNGRFYLKSTAILTDELEHRSWQTVGIAREADKRTGMSEDQLSGAASSYARKYALNAMFLTDDNQDADNKKPKVTPEPLSDKEQQTLNDIHNRLIDVASENNLIPDKAAIKNYLLTKTNAKRLPVNEVEIAQFVDGVVKSDNLKQVCKPMPRK